MTLVWILLGVLYVVCWVVLGLATFRRGHYLLFWVGFIVGAVIGPTQRAAARGVA